MPSAWTPIRVDVTFPTPHRGGTGTPVAPRQFYAQSINYTQAWGSEPATAEIVYVGGAPPVTVGYHLKIQCGGHVIYGLCKSDTGVFSASGGIKRTLKFVDMREYLDWDNVYGAFNLADRHIVSGKSERRYKHLLPANYNSWTWTYTNTPYTASEILDFIFVSQTTQDIWTRVYHQDQFDYAVYDLDFTSGSKLKAALQTISDAQGLTFAVLPTNPSHVIPSDAYRLVWARKGEGTLPSFTADSDDRESGLTLSDQPTRVRVLGDRNHYMVCNITLEKDWVTAWEAFWDFMVFQEDIYQRGIHPSALTITDPDGGTYSWPANTPYATIGAHASDPEQMVARQLAAARANVITLKEYVAMLNDDTPGSGDTYKDYRKFSGRSRMDMPCKLYINNILFRAFRIPSDFTFVNKGGQTVGMTGVRIADKMVASVTHDVTTGTMTADLTQNHDGNGYAVAQGYMVGSDLFKTIQPERFKLSEWTTLCSLWQHVEFQVDDSGEEQNQFIIFNDPVINSADLITIVNGYAVFKANPTFTVPDVMATLTLEAEKYSYIKGTGNRDDFENVGGLYGEYVCDTPTSTPVEQTFADGTYADDKADEIADTLLQRQYSIYRGSMKRHIVQNPDGSWPTGTQITGMIDRVSMMISPSGYEETVSLTAEYPRKTYIPLRDLERQTKQRTLLPGQKELQIQANQQRLIAMALKADPSMRKTLTDAIKGFIGGESKTAQVTLP